MPKAVDKTRWRPVPAFGILYAIVTLTNFYIFDRITGLLGWGDVRISVIYAFTLSTLLLVGFLARTSSGRGTRGLFVTVTTAYGLEFATISGLIIFEIANLFLSLNPRNCGIALLLYTAVLAAISIVNAQLLGVKNIKLPFVKKLRIVQLSDVHIGAVHGRRYLKRVIDTVNTLKPDLVLITGDILSGAVPPGSSKLEHFGRLESRTFLAPGNHEFYEGMEEVRAALPKNVEMLRDEEVSMNGYSIFGLDYIREQGMSGTRKIDRKFHNPVIALAHVPQFLDLPDGSIILSGHYHAGQIFPINFIGRLFVKYFKGIYRNGGITLYVSPGTATWGPAMRFGSRNEITVLDLVPEMR
ncbi:MAG: metallophosphoesterase [Euryarchaeota archaeon]|nr:metallophosphoesterase [Euryarchaeota archaeon]